MWDHLCACDWVDVCAPVHECRSPSLVFFETVSLLDRSSLSRLSRVACEPQRSSCFCLSRASFIGAGHHA